MELGIIRLKLHTPTTHSRRSLKASDGARSQGATKKRHPVRTVPSRNLIQSNPIQVIFTSFNNAIGSRVIFLYYLLHS